MEYILHEGFLGDTWKRIKMISSPLVNKVKDATSKTTEFIVKNSIMPILRLGGLALSVATGGWGGL